VTAEDVARPKQVKAPEADAFAAAALANGAAEGDRRGNGSALPNLFRRITGIGGAGAGEPARPVQAPAPAQSAPAQAGKAGPSLAVDPGTRPHASRADEEMLEIPAFLRRQAN